MRKWKEKQKKIYIREINQSEKWKGEREREGMPFFGGKSKGGFDSLLKR